MLRALLLAYLVLPAAAHAQHAPDAIEALSGTDLGSGRIVDELRVSRAQLNAIDFEEVVVTIRPGVHPVIVASEGYVLVATVEDDATTADCTAPRVRCAILEAGPGGRVIRIDD